MKERKRYLIEQYQKKYPQKSKQEILTYIETEFIANNKDSIILNDALNRAVEIFRNKLGICCFTEVKDNILMWAHYAKQHTGYCLEFNVNNDFFKLLSRSQKVNYEFVLPEFNIVKQDSYIEGKLDELLLTKAIDWQYENEWRIVDNKKGKGIQNFPEDALVGVIFGCRTSEENKEKIVQWCKKRKFPPSLYEAKAKEKEYGLDIVKIENN